MNYIGMNILDADTDGNKQHCESSKPKLLWQDSMEYKLVIFKSTNS